MKKNKKQSAVTINPKIPKTPVRDCVQIGDLLEDSFFICDEDLYQVFDGNGINIRNQEEEITDDDVLDNGWTVIPVDVEIKWTVRS